jgi:hypothetical protein
MPVGIRREKVDELQVKKPHVALHKAAVFVKNTRKAPSLSNSKYWQQDDGGRVEEVTR